MNITYFSTIELVWTLTNLVTLAVTVWLFREAIIDHRLVVKEGINGLYRRVTKGSVRRFMLKIIIAGGFTLAGVYAGLFIPPSGRDGGVSLEAMVTIGLLMVADLALLLLALEAADERRYAMEHLEAWRPRNTS